MLTRTCRRQVSLSALWLQNSVAAGHLGTEALAALAMGNLAGNLTGLSVVRRLGLAQN